MKARRAICRKHGPVRTARLTLTMPVALLHDLEAAARIDGVSLDMLLEAACNAAANGARCVHGISLFAVGAAACVRCTPARRDVAVRRVRGNR